MSNLKTYKFSQLYDFSSGISTKPEQSGHGFPFISFSTVFNNYFLPDVIDDLMDTSEKERESYSVKKGDILLTRTSETIDELAMSSVALKDYPNTTYSGFTKRLRPLQNNVTYEKFMGFYLRSKLFRRTMTNNAVLTLRASLNEQIFSYLDLILPPYKEQIKIGDLLHLLNQKIELNNKINKELEAMAKTLYDYWFVQFDFPDENGKPYKSSGGKMVYNLELKREIPKGWDVKDLEEICEIYQPQTISEKEMIKDGKYFVFGANGIVGMYDKYNHEDSEVTITCRGNSCGTLNRTLPYSWITGNAMVVRFKDDKIHNEYLMQLLSWTKMDNVITGSAQPQITRTNLAPLKILIPKNNILDNFSQKMEFNINLQLKNIEQNQELAKLRDWLLPMLMNGQVKVEI